MSFRMVATVSKGDIETDKIIDLCAEWDEGWSSRLGVVRDEDNVAHLRASVGATIASDANPVNVARRLRTFADQIDAELENRRDRGLQDV